jgi:hypothetical protein
MLPLRGVPDSALVLPLAVLEVHVSNVFPPVSSKMADPVCVASITVPAGSTVPAGLVKTVAEAELAANAIRAVAAIAARPSIFACFISSSYAAQCAGCLFGYDLRPDPYL